jgi:hypothetical protein
MKAANSDAMDRSMSVTSFACMSAIPARADQSLPLASVRSGLAC